ncbi:hypothetical protein [Syntrophomonas palmitatica]|uniref:hypothetical protein n=1 Tax=Syntrophomonas palmitatica TaxID=402877 RepID=UPI0009F8EF40
METSEQEIVFRGLVEAAGRVVSIKAAENKYQIIKIDIGNLAENIRIDDHISVNGICLTVKDIQESVITVHVWLVTAIKTNIITLKTGDFVNLERNRAGQIYQNCFIKRDG